MLQTASLTRGTFIQRAANLFRAAWAPCVKKYVWKIPGERESFNFTFTSTKYLSRYYVGRLQTNVSLLAKQHPSEDYVGISQSLFFPSSSTHIMREEKLSDIVAAGVVAKKKELSPVVTERWTAALLAIVSRRETDILHLRFWINNHYSRARKKSVTEDD